MNPLISF